MADESDMKTKRHTGTLKYLDKQGIGYIAAGIEVFVTPSSLSSNNKIKEGDRVEFTMKFNDTNPHFEAIDVVPIKVKCFTCKIYGHSSKECPSNSWVLCRKCGEIGHFGKDCGKEKSPRLKNGGSSVGSTSNSKSPIVSVRKKEDVKKVEKVEDCFILEFDPTKKDDDDDDDDDEDNCRSIVCVKNVEDVKKVEEVEDCFILEFDPNEPVKFGNLSLCDDDDDDVSIIAEKGKVACRDYPHPRSLCGTHPFQTTPHEVHCKMCYCYVCEKPAPCKTWTKAFSEFVPKHCDATGDVPFWSSYKKMR